MTATLPAAPTPAGFALLHPPYRLATCHRCGTVLAATRPLLDAHAHDHKERDRLADRLNQLDAEGTT